MTDCQKRTVDEKLTVENERSVDDYLTATGSSKMEVDIFMNNTINTWA